jgi:hypothetical protein
MMVLVAFLAVDLVLAGGYDPAEPLKAAVWDKVCQ